MKFATNILTALSLHQIVGASAAKHAGKVSASNAVKPAESLNEEGRLLDARYSCFGDEDFTVYFKGVCDYDHLVERMTLKIESHPRCINTGAEEVQLLVGVMNPRDEDVARQRVRNLCEETIKEKMADPSYVVPWVNVANKGPQFDKEYFDGNTFWNEEYQTDLDPLIPGEPSNVLEDDAERVDDLYETVLTRVPFQWPDYMPNFEDCGVRSAMCCWTTDRQANDNNGNCAQPYDQNCVDADPADNCDLCGVDITRSGGDSVHMGDGFATYPGDDNNGEGAIHCHGLAWGQDFMEPDARFKANNLFYVSMSDHMHDRGYVRNVPGAPMCGCLEKMPIVSRSDCTEMHALEVWKFSWDAAEQVFEPDLDRTKIEFAACRGDGRNNDLESFYKRLVREGRATYQDYQKFQRTIVGNNNCPSAIENLYFDMGYEKN